MHLLVIYLYSFAVTLWVQTTLRLLCLIPKTDLQAEHILYVFPHIFASLEIMQKLMPKISNKNLNRICSEDLCNMYLCVQTVEHPALPYCSTALVCCVYEHVCLPLSVIENRVALRWQLARLIPLREGHSPAPGVTQTCQAWRRCIQPGRLVSVVPCHSVP